MHIDLPCRIASRTFWTGRRGHPKSSVGAGGRRLSEHYAMATNQLHHSLKSFIFVSIILGIALARPGLTQGAAESTVKLEAKTEAGDVLSSPSASLVDPTDVQSVAVFHDSAASGVPYGVYILRIREPGFKWHEQKIEVDTSEIVVRVRLVVSNILDTVRLR